jgi:hypothetical protein
MCFGIKLLRHFARLEIVPAPLVVFYVVGNQHRFAAVLRTGLYHQHVVVLKNDFGVDPF